MNSDQYGSGIITLLLGVACLVIGIVSIKKKRFLETDDFSGFQTTLFLPPIVNFWLLKLFLIISGSLFIVFGIYLIVIGVF